MAVDNRVETYHIITFGCQMNQYDSSKMMGILASIGMVSTEEPEFADLILINSCSIREKAEGKVFSLIGRLAKYKQRNPHMIIGLCGCMATLRKKEIFRQAPMLDILFGADSMEKLPELIKKARSGKKASHIKFSRETVWDSIESHLEPSAVSGMVGIMKGCDNRCSYCVVPATRGDEISRPVESVLSEVRFLVSKGIQEITLIGQTVNSYGKGVGSSLPQLLQEVEKVSGVRRIRFTTSHPKDLNDELINVMANSSKICHALHLPVQSGSDRILEMMGRGYSSAEYISKIEKLKKAMPNIGLSTDIMIGFPSETEGEFMDSYRMIEQLEFDTIFMFNYSRRPDTPAADYDGQIERGISQDRFDRAYTLFRSIVEKKNEKRIGSLVELLCEGAYNGKVKGLGDKKLYYGRTDKNLPVAFKPNIENPTGKILNVRVTGYSGFNLIGEME